MTRPNEKDRLELVDVVAGLQGGGDRESLLAMTFADLCQVYRALILQAQAAARIVDLDAVRRRASA